MGLVCREMSGRSVSLWRMNCPDSGAFVRRAWSRSSRLETTPFSTQRFQLSIPARKEIIKERIKEMSFYIRIKIWSK